jgi:hypothetical protein
MLGTEDYVGHVEEGLAAQRSVDSLVRDKDHANTIRPSGDKK